MSVLQIKTINEKIYENSNVKKCKVPFITNPYSYVRLEIKRGVKNTFGAVSIHHRVQVSIFIVIYVSNPSDACLILTFHLIYSP
jgi:hypothetical protein